MEDNIIVLIGSYYGKDEILCHLNKLLIFVYLFIYFWVPEKEIDAFFSGFLLGGSEGCIAFSSFHQVYLGIFEDTNH